MQIVGPKIESNYLSCDYIEAVSRFQQLLQTIFRDPYQFEDYQVYQGSRSALQRKKFEQLQQGCNKETLTSFYVFRIISDNLSSYLLVSQRDSPQKAKHYYLLVVLCTNKVLPKWRKQIGFGMKIAVKQITVEGKLNNQMVVCATRVENIILEPSKKKVGTLEQIRKSCRELFDKRKFYEALIQYQYALATPLLYENNTQRAVLYANSSACLFQIKAYESSSKYAQIAVNLDQAYPKAYAKKIFSLLETKKFEEIPSLLVTLNMKIHAQQFAKIYKKYTVYLANSIGQFNWHEFFAFNQNPRQQCYFGEYQSEKIQITKDSSTNTLSYYASKDIEPYELLLVKKPIMFKKYSDVEKGTDILQQFQKYLVLERSFLKAIDYIAEDIDRPTRARDGKSNRKYKLSQIFYDRKQSQDSNYEGKGIGIWPDMFFCSQSCEPNCTFLTNRNALCISSVKKIAKGTLLTIDYACMEAPTERKNYLKKAYQIDCSCRICKWEQWPNNLADFYQIAGLIESLKNLKMLKQLIWAAQQKHSLLLSEGSSTFNLAIVEKFLKVVAAETHWQDIHNLISLMRQKKSPKTKKYIEKAIAEGLSKFLKIPATDTLTLIDRFL